MAKPKSRMVQGVKVSYQEVDASGRPQPQSKPMIAPCGHDDPLGHLTGTACGKCARKNHKKAMGR